MSKCLIRPQYEEFWDDCLKITPKKNTKKNELKLKNSQNKAIGINVSKNNLGNYTKIVPMHRNKSVKGKNYNLLKQILTNEESVSKSIEKRKQAQINILSTLYNNHIIKLKKVQRETLKLKENLIQKEKKNCPFKPHFESKSTHRSSSEKMYKYGKGKKIYERAKDFQNKLYTKLKTIKNNATILDKIEYSFKPEINHNNIEKILYGNNFWDDFSHNLSNELFLRRYKKARDEENIKNKNKIWNIKYYDNNANNEYIKYNNNKNIHKSISQKDSLLYKQTLHNYLLEYESNSDDTEENKNNKENIKIFKN